MSATDYYETLGQEDMDIGTSVVSKRNPAGGLLSTTQVNIASFAVGQLRSSTSWTPGTLVPGDSATTTVTVTGAAEGDFVLVAFSEMPSSGGVMISGYVSATDTVTVTILNPSTVGGVATSSQALTAGTVYALVFKSR